MTDHLDLHDGDLVRVEFKNGNPPRSMVAYLDGFTPEFDEARIRPVTSDMDLLGGGDLRVARHESGLAYDVAVLDAEPQIVPLKTISVKLGTCPPDVQKFFQIPIRDRQDFDEYHEILELDEREPDWRTNHHYDPLWVKHKDNVAKRIETNRHGAAENEAVSDMQAVLLQIADRRGERVPRTRQQELYGVERSEFIAKFDAFCVDVLESDFLDQFSFEDLDLKWNYLDAEQQAKRRAEARRKPSHVPEILRIRRGGSPRYPRGG